MHFPTPTYFFFNFQGVVFYLRDNRVVGTVIWNMFDRIPVARELIRRAEKFENLDDLKRIFKVHETAPPPAAATESAAPESAASESAAPAQPAAAA